jgi:general stress protein 26
MTFDYDKLKDEIISVLEREQSIVLATSVDNKVTARTMSHVNDGLIIYFQTGGDSEKAQQIEQNANIAFAISNIQIEAFVEKCGHPLELQNKLFIEKYKLKFPAYFEKYTKLPDEILFKAYPIRIKLYKYIDGMPYITVLNVSESRMYSE